MSQGRFIRRLSIALVAAVAMAPRLGWSQETDKGRKPSDLASVFESHRDRELCDRMFGYPAASAWSQYGLFKTVYKQSEESAKANDRNGAEREYGKEYPVPQLLQLRAKVMITPEIEPDLHAYHVFFGSTWQGDDRDVALVKRLRHAVQIGFYYAPISDAALETLTELPALTDLDVRYTGISDVGLASIARATTLRRLTIVEESVSPEAVVKTAVELPNLEELRLDASRIRFEKSHQDEIGRKKPVLKLVLATSRSEG